MNSLYSRILGITDEFSEGCGGGSCSPSDDYEACKEDDGIDDTFPMGDDEDISDDDIDDFDGLSDTAPVDAVDDSDLTPDEEMEADKYMSVMGTSVLVQSELSDDEKQKFAESARDIRIALNEGLISESVADQLMNSANDLYTEGKYSKPTMIRLDKKDKLKQLYSIAIYAVARSKNDPDFQKLTILNQKRRALKHRLAQKYDGPAKQRMKVYFRRLSQSKSAPLKKLVNAVTPGK